MAEFKQRSTSFEKTKDRANVELHVLSEEDVIESKYMGTDSDRHDMTVLGRKQVLRVCIYIAAKTVGFEIETSLLGDTIESALIVSSSAQFSISIHRGICRRPDLYLGNSLRVCGYPFGGRQMTVR